MRLQTYQNEIAIFLRGLEQNRLKGEEHGCMVDITDGHAIVEVQKDTVRIAEWRGDHYQQWTGSYPAAAKRLEELGIELD